MAPIRARLRLRIIFLGFSCLLLILCYPIFLTETRQEWKAYQGKYHALYKKELSRRLEEANTKANQEEVKQWSTLIEEANNSRPHIAQVCLPEAGVIDLCTTCHLGMENPLFKEESNPFKLHPAQALRDHKPGRFGCTLCHHGQGVGLEATKAHGYEYNWPYPRVPKRFLQGLCLGCHESPFGLEGAEKAENGRRLFIQHGCYGCHEARGIEWLPSMSTRLDGAGKKISSKAWMYRWLKDPPSLRPHTRMPTFRLDEKNVKDIVAYLASDKNLARPLAIPSSNAGASSKEGAQLFVDKGCRGCHSIDMKTRSLTDRVPNLAGAGLKLDSQWVMTWLEDPRALQPQTPMPKPILNDEERRNLTAYVRSLTTEAVRRLLENVPEKPWEGAMDEGRKQVQLLGCYGCHKIKEMEKSPVPGVEVAGVANKKLEELPFGNAQIPKTKWDWIFNKVRKPEIYETKDMPLKMPNYSLTDEEVEALTVYYLHNRYYDLPERYLRRISQKNRLLMEGEWYLEQYNCRGCHQIEKDLKPGIEQYLALKSLVPPSLLGEGEKVQPQWFFQFLSRPVALRPWLKIRMPEFGFTYEERGNLIQYFSELLDSGSQTSVPYVVLPVREDYDAKILAMGEYRIQQDKCIQCHPISFDGTLPEGIKVEDLSINLMLSKNRLRFEWIKNFLRNPDKYAGAGTKMPFVFYSPDGIPRIPDPEKWIGYASLFLLFMEKVPEAAKQEKIEEVRPGSDVDWTQY